MDDDIFAKNVISVFIFSLFTGLSGYLLRIILARNLTVEEFGLFYSVLTIFFFISYIVDAGISYSLSKKIIDFRVKGKTNSIKNIFFTTLLIQLFFTILLVSVLFVFRNFLSINYFHMNANMLIVLMCAWLVLLPIYSCLTSLFYGFNKVVSYSIIDFLKSVFLVVGSIVFIYLGYSILSGAIAYIVSILLSLILMIVWLRKIYSLSFKFSIDIKNSKNIIYFGFFVLLSNFLWTFITQIDTIMVTYFTNPSSVAMYQIGIATASVLLFFTNAVIMVLFPKISELKASKKIKSVSTSIFLVYKYLSIILIPSIVFLFLFPDLLIELLFTSKYFGAIDVLKILLISTFFSSITIVNNSVLLAIEKPKVVIKNMLFIAGLNIVLNFIFISKYGIIGAALATFISFIFSSIISSISLKKIINFNYPLRTWRILVFLMSALFILFTYSRNFFNFNSHFEKIVLVLVFAIIYFVTLFLFKEINIKQLLNLLKK